MDRDELLEKPVVQKYLHNIVGPEGIQVALSPPDGEFTDEELADELGEEVNTVRRVLIILNDHNLCKYRRVRDKESGWLTYYWTTQYSNIPKQLKEEMEVLQEKLKERYEYERNSQFFMCNVCYQRYEFNDVYDTGFVCPQCGSDDLESKDFEDIEEYIKKRIDDIQEELDSVKSNF